MRSFFYQEREERFKKIWSWALNFRAKGKEDKRAKGGFVALCSIKDNFFPG